MTVKENKQKKEGIKVLMSQDEDLMRELLRG